MAIFPELESTIPPSAVGFGSRKPITKADHAAYFAAAYSKQSELDFLAKYELTPLSLLYLNLVYLGDFDKRIHRGELVNNVGYIPHIRALLQAGLINYDGRHTITPRGSAHIKQLLETKVLP